MYNISALIVLKTNTSFETPPSNFANQTFLKYVRILEKRTSPATNEFVFGVDGKDAAATIPPLSGNIFSVEMYSSKSISFVFILIDI